MAYRSYRRFRLSPILIIILVNSVLFIATLIAPIFVFYLGLQPLTLSEKPWTMVTNLFVHGGWWHLIANMLTLYFFGRYLSRLIGEGKSLLVYFGGGIFGNILYVLLALYVLPASRFSIVIGASGAVFALGGTLAILRPKLPVFIFPLPVPIPLWLAVIGGFLILTAAPNIAWQAHLGGLIVGVVAGYIFKRRVRYFSF